MKVSWDDYCQMKNENRSKLLSPSDPHKLTYYLACILTFHLAFYLAFRVASYLTHILAFYLTYILANFLAILSLSIWHIP